MKRVAVISSVIMHYRVPIFEKINMLDNIKMMIYHGSDIRNSKFKNFRKPVSFEHRELFTFQYAKGYRTLKFFPSLLIHLISLNPDVLLLEGETNMLNNAIIFIYCKLFSKPFIWWGLGLIPGEKETLYQRLYRPLKKLMLKHAAFIIGYSNYSKQHYAQFVDNSDKILVSYNCLDDQRIDREIADEKPYVEKLKKEMSLSNKKVLLYVGNIEPEKQVDKLIKAYKILKDEFQDLALLIVGKGSALEQLVTLTRNLDLSDVHFTGEVIDHVSRYFLLGDLFILPGLGGLAIHHAMIHSLPVIAARADGTERDLVVNDYNGYLLETDTVEELVQRIRSLVIDNARLKQMGLNSRKIVDQKINIDNMVGVFRYALEKA